MFYIAKDDDKDGELSEDNFVKAFQESDPNISEEDVRRIFRDADVDDSGGKSHNLFLAVLSFL
jgi:Ca2+-binding EF-hand superfamily protein